MDLGATLCSRSKPECLRCPLSATCLAFEQGNPQDYPGKKTKAEKPVKSVKLLLLINHEGQCLLEQRPATGIWGGLWSFPEVSLEVDEQGYCEDRYGKAGPSENLPAFRHTFSHYHLDITPVRVALNVPIHTVGEGSSNWFALSEVPKVGLAAPVKKLWQQLQSLKEV